MIAAALTVLACCGPQAGVSRQLVAMQNQLPQSGTCIAYDSKKTIEQQVASLSDIEVMARLVYAETLSTRCTDQDTRGMMDGIATVIANRTKQSQYGRGIRGVVFKRSQFNSSLSTQYSRSEYRRFLCHVSNPRDRKQTEMWEYAKQASERAMNPRTPNFLGSPQVTMTYYYKHFLPKVVAPPCFANPNSRNRVQNPPGTDRACIGFFYDRPCS